MRIAIGADHAGFAYKSLLRDVLRARGMEVHDVGTHSSEPTDYPRVVQRVADTVASGASERGIIVGGSGNGEAMAANRVRGVRCSLCWSVESARLARAHNNANVLALGERLVGFEDAVAIVDVWLATQFEGGRHARRIAQLDAMRSGLANAQRTGALLNGGLIALGAMGLLDNVLVHWWLGLHRAIPGRNALAVEILLTMASAALISIGVMRERRVRRMRALACSSDQT